MSRSYKRLIRIPPKPLESEGKVNNVRSSKSDVEVEEVFPLKLDKSGRLERQTLIGDKYRTSRSTYHGPSYNHFGQLTDIEPPDNYGNILREQFGLEPTVPETIKQPEKFKKLHFQHANMVDISSQCNQPITDNCNKQTHLANSIDLSEEESHWRNVDTTDELDRYLRVCKVKNAEVQNDGKSSIPIHPKNIRISEMPRVKVVAEKFSKYKRYNIELRKLEEKVVCLEYDIFDQDAATSNPLQKMRAFFSIKPSIKSQGNENEDSSTSPSDVKHNFNMIFNMIEDVDLNILDKKEIEIIDGEIAENQSFLEDLKKVLRRKQAVQNKKKRTTLDLMSLYEMARRESPPLDDDYSNTNLLSKAELEEIKDLILKKCASSARGISRRTVKTEKQDESVEPCAMSGSFIEELMRDKYNSDTLKS